MNNINIFLLVLLHIISQEECNYFLIFFLQFFQSDYKRSMIQMRKLLSDSGKAKRHRRKILNIQITFLAWLVESLGFLVIFLGTFILGHESNIFNFFMQTLTLIIYFVILPFVFLIGDFNIRTNIVTSNWYGTVLTFFNCNYVKPIDNDEEEDISVNDSAEVENSNRDESNDEAFGDDGCHNGKRNGKLFKRTFKEGKQKDAIENRNEIENNDAVHDQTEAPSSTQDIVVIDLENT